MNIQQLSDLLKLPLGKFYLEIPALIQGETQNIRVVTNAEILNNFKKCKVEKIDFLNYKLQWDCAYMMSDSDKDYNQGLEQQKEITQNLNILQ